ncbi:MAG: hypothetical protein IKO43_05270 [Kiritimatiellae bacterium]|nr:hypothetical protein [Kiritimatiellia bacterium]
MPKAKHISRIRAAAGRKGAAARWGDGRQTRATACLRAYPDDAALIRQAARVQGVLPADVIAALAAALTPPPGI